jgi:hypothetical protein
MSIELTGFNRLSDADIVSGLIETFKSTSLTIYEPLVSHKLGYAIYPVTGAGDLPHSVMGRVGQLFPGHRIGRYKNQSTPDVQFLTVVSSKRALTKYVTSVLPEVFLSFKEFIKPLSLSNLQRSQFIYTASHEGISGSIAVPDMEKSELLSIIENSWYGFKVIVLTDESSVYRLLFTSETDPDHGDRVVTTVSKITKRLLESEYLKPPVDVGELVSDPIGTSYTQDICLPTTRTSKTMSELESIIHDLSFEVDRRIQLEVVGSKDEALAVRLRYLIPTKSVCSR